MIMVGDNAYFQVCLHMYVIPAALCSRLAMAVFRSFSRTARVLYRQVWRGKTMYSLSICTHNKSISCPQGDNLCAQYMNRVAKITRNVTQHNKSSFNKTINSALSI